MDDEKHVEHTICCACQLNHFLRRSLTSQGITRIQLPIDISLPQALQPLAELISSLLESLADRASWLSEAARLDRLNARILSVGEDGSERIGASEGRLLARCWTVCDGVLDGDSQF